MTRHYTDEDLTLYYYGEGRRRADIESHLESCAQCAALYRELTGTLALVSPPDVPERGDQYGLEVWQTIRHQLPARERFGWVSRLSAFSGFAWGALAAALILVAFVAGRTSRVNVASVQTRESHDTPEPVAAVGPSNSAKRILLTSVADHLDRSERVLTDIMNTSDHGDISMEQAWAEDLLDTSRLYRQDAIAAGEPSVAAVLDELERNLLEIVHSPSRISNDDLEQIRRRIDAAALLFKVRVLGDELRRRNQTS
ncbi:MAG TPA: hypothetical protein VFA27_00905 [Vicinamibacterales bacterium]|nr:hypothetical protein [Vicinamibacterales bacterium]